MLYFCLASDLEQSLEVLSSYEGSCIKIENGINQPIPIKFL